MLVSWMKLCCQLLLFSLSWGNIDSTGPGSGRTAPVSVPPLISDTQSVVFKGASQVQKVEVLKPTNLALECTWTGNQNKPPNITGYWRKDGSELTNSRLTVLLENEQYNLKRAFSIADEKSLGNYSCVFDNKAEVDFILAAPRMEQVRDKPIVSYVGDSVVLECKMEDPKPKPNTWVWYRANETQLELIDTEADPRRYQVQNQEGKTTLTVQNLTEADTGPYHCGAVYDISTTTSRMELRVITFMEPLKPFLVIVVEVILLVSIILLYERGKARGAQQVDNALSDDQSNKLAQDESCSVDTDSTTRQRNI